MSPDNELTLAGGGVSVFAYAANPAAPDGSGFETKAVRLPLALLLEHDLACARGRFGATEPIDTSGPPAATGPKGFAARARKSGLVKIAHDLWLPRRRRPFMVCERHEIRLRGFELGVTEKLLVDKDTLHVLGLEGPPFVVRRDDEDACAEVIARFAEGYILEPARPERCWPPPLPPIAVVLRGSGDDEDEDLSGHTIDRLLRRPCYVVSLYSATFELAALESLPFIASDSLHTYITSHTEMGIFHPDREVPREGPKDCTTPHLVFGHPDPAWESLARLSQGA